MDANDQSGDQIFSEQWNSLVTSTCDTLERNDIRQVSIFNSWDDVQKQMFKTQSDPLRQTIHQEFVMLSRGLAHLKDFTNIISSHVVPRLDTSPLWGLIGLIAKIIQDEGATVTRIPRMLRELCHKIEILNKYCGDSSNSISGSKDACFETATSIFSFLSDVVKFMRNTIDFTNSIVSCDSDWQPLEQQFTNIAREIDSSVSRIEKMSEIAERSKAQSQLTSIPLRPHIEEQAKLPCAIFPSFRTSRFFDRTDVFQNIEKHFDKVDAEQSFRSLALYGLGGIGKSSVALRFAETKLRKGELDAMFWVHGEKLNTIKQSFTDIAMRLKLPDAQPKDHYENRALVLNWLQHTQCRWLIVYDNVESMELLLDHWPAASRGQAIITTRNRSFAFTPADAGLEIKTWDADTGSKFLLHLLSTDISEQLAADEASSAQQLSQKLSGHALAIATMAGLIHRRAWSITEFVKMYEKRPGKLFGLSGNSAINAIWEISFKSLDQQCSALLGIFCYLSPDGVPQSLFEAETSAGLPESLAFCSDPFNFMEAIEDLLTLALIKRDKDSRTFSIHRLVQTSFKYFLNHSQRQKSFDDAMTLVSNVYPRRDFSTAQLYLKWKQCALYLPHVINLKDCFREEKKENPDFKASKLYCDLNNACQRYLLEINAYTDLDDLVDVNSMALKTLPEQEDTVDLHGSLTSHKGQVLSRTGKPVDGVKWLKDSYEIRGHAVPLNLQLSAWAASNVANGLGCINEFSEAIEWEEIARDHWLDWSEKNGQDKNNWPASMKKGMGTTLIWAGKRDQARAVLDQALRQIESTEPYNWAVASFAYFALGTADLHERHLESAEASFMEAQNLWLKGDQLRSDPFNAACMYRLGCVSLNQGKIEAAIKHLQDARVVTEMRKHNMIAEHARCLFKLSEAFEQEPRSEGEARKLRNEAERLLFQCDPNAAEPGLEKTYDALVSIQWR